MNFDENCFPAVHKYSRSNILNLVQLHKLYPGTLATLAAVYIHVYICINVGTVLPDCVPVAY
jgi:hypothetical protein